MRAPDELRALVESSLGRLELHARARRARRSRCATRSAAAASGSGRCSASRPPRRRAARSEDALPAAVALELVHALLARARRPAGARRRRRAARPAERARRVRRGRRAARGRRPARRGVPARAVLRPARAGPRARRGDARDDRRSVPRHHGRRRRLEELHRLKTGRLFAAAVGLGLWVAGVPERASRRRGVRSARSSACCSSSSTTCSTATATRPRSARTARAAGGERPRARAHARLEALDGRHVRARGDRRRARRPHRLTLAGPCRTGSGCHRAPRFWRRFAHVDRGASVSS